MLREDDSLATEYIAELGLSDDQGRPADSPMASAESVLSFFKQFGPFTKIRRVTGPVLQIYARGAAGVLRRVEASVILDGDLDEELVNELKLFVA